MNELSDAALSKLGSLSDSSMQTIIVKNYEASVRALHRETMRELGDVMQDRESVDCDASVTDLIALARALETIIANFV